MFLAQIPLPQALGSPRAACSSLAAVPRVPVPQDPWIGSRAWRPREQFGGAGPAWAGPSVPAGTEASPLPEPAPPRRVSQGFPWYVPSCGPSGVLRWEQPCSGSAPWLRPGARLSKSSGGAAQTGRRGRCWGLRMERARQICSQSVTGLGFAGTVLARRCIPCARRGLGRPPSCLHVTWEGSCTLLSCQPSSSKDLPSPSCFLEPAAGLSCV